MNWLDFVILVLILFSAVSGLRKGLSRELIGLVASVLALVLALWFYQLAGQRIAPFVDSAWAASLGGFLLIFFGVLTGGALLSALAGSVLRAVGLSPVDRVLGAAFGLGRGLLFSFGVISVMLAFLPAPLPGRLPQPVAGSRLAPYLIEFSHVIVPLAPGDLKQSFERQYRQVKSTWEKKAES